MKIHSLKLKNFMLYKSFDETFDDKNIVGITCKYNDNKNKSNRGGKSTIIEAVSYALFGLTRASKEIELIHYGQDFMYVELVLIDGNKKYKIKRGRDQKNNNVLEVDLLEKSKEVKKEIETLIGFNKDDFLLTNYFRQNEINRFMDLKHTEKKNYLMELFGNQYWVKYEKKVLEYLKDKTNRLKSIMAKSETYADEIDELDDIKIKAEINNLSNEIIIKKKTLKKVTKLYNDIKEKYNYSDNKNKLNDYKIQLEELNKKISDKEEIKEKYDDILLEYKALKKKDIEYDQDEFDKNLEKLIKTKSAINDLRKEIVKIENSHCGICPVLNESCNRIESDPNLIKLKKQELKKHKKLKGNFQKKNDDLIDAKNHISYVGGLKNKLLNLRPNVESLNDDLILKHTIVKHIKNLERISDSHGVNIKEKLELTSKKIKKTTNYIYTLNEKLGQQNSLLEQINDMQNKKVNIDREIKTLNGEIENLRYVSFMFSKNGIPSQQIENAFDEIESEINFILNKLETNLQVIFNPEKELSTWESTCLSCGFQFPKGKKIHECPDCGFFRQKRKKDELHIKIVENNNESNFSMESGGGKTLVSLAVRIALAKIKMKQNNSKFNVLFLDEPDSSLDPFNKNKFIKLITEILTKYYNFEQIFWITHEKNIQESINDVLQINRFNNYSNATWI